jgi:hypothetical protein
MRFGCEFEFSTEREDATKFVKESVAKLYGTGSLMARGYCEETYRNYKKWQLKDEATTGCELSSPISCVYDIDKMRQLLITLAKHVEISEECGVHVHVEGRKVASQRGLTAAWLLFEQEIFSLFPVSRRDNMYCERLNKDWRKSRFVAELFEDAMDSCDDHHSAMSLSSYDSRGTVEFRLMEGTLNPNDVTNWVRFCLYFVRYAGMIDMVSALCRKTDEFNFSDLCREMGVRNKKLTDWMNERHERFKRSRKKRS